MNLLITAGPTHEAIDPVRYIANRSSGKMGFAIAAAAAARAWHVTLIAGPVALATPPGVRRVDVVSAEDMYQAVARECLSNDAAILCAAVADYRPIAPASQKLKKSADSGMRLELEQTKDILGSMRAPLGFRGVLVGFAAETQAVLENAAAKLQRKGCDMLVANDVSRTDIGFASDDNQVTLLYRDARPPEHLPKLGKPEVAAAILDRVARLAEQTPEAGAPPARTKAVSR